MRRVFLGVLCVVVVALTGCQARGTVDVDLQSNGTGRVAVDVELDKAAAAAVPDLKQQLEASDLVEAGWEIDGPHDADGGGKRVGARHAFSTPEEANALLRELSGGGPPFSNFRLTQSRSVTKASSTFEGTIDLRQGPIGFGDVALQQSAGSRLGFDPDELQQSLGFDWAKTFPVDVDVSLPGTSRHFTPETDDGAWHGVYGEAIEVRAEANGWNLRPLAFFGVSIAAFVAMILVLVFWKSAKYRPKHL